MEPIFKPKSPRGRPSHRGRPKKGQEPGERVPLSLRVTPSTKEGLDRAAEENGRSRSQEAEMRLERSLHDDRLLSEMRKLFVEFSNGGCFAG